ncbi:MAG TPA: hypothetical protein VGN38_03995 [Caulobacteraceae bacterium]|jgi:hypothetical protein|nr:hypothetical protein [Caulobacteraceae bacterium]
MPRLSLAFFTAAVLCGMTGMIWGANMAATNTFTMAPAHAHLNLLGWVTLAMMGAFYALAGDRAPIRLGWVNFVLSTAGVVVTIPALVALLGGEKSAERLTMIGAMVVMAGMLTFLAAVVSLWARPRAA